MRESVAVLGLAATLPLLSACGRSADPAPATTASPTASPTTMASAEATAGPVNPDPRVGAMFLGGGTLHTCTASVVHSAGGDLVLTAAHCLAEGVPATFVPGFHDTADPADIWNVDAVYLDPRWVATQDPLADYAIVRVSRTAGGTIESTVGSALTLGTAPAAGTIVATTGYALGEGGGPVGCQGATGVAPGGFPSLPCTGLVDGTSGAPWVTGSTVSGLIGGLDGGGCDDNVSYSPPFDDQTAQLLARAEAGGPADPAPSTYADEC